MMILKGSPIKPPDAFLLEIDRRLAYDQITGALTWLAMTGNKNDDMLGKRAGTIHVQGWRQVGMTIGGVQKLFKAYHLAWYLSYNEWPPSIIDHKNGDNADDRLANLRLATASGNARNQRLHTRNTSGVRGVSWSRANKKWLAQISLDNHHMNLGLYDTIEEATAVRQKAELRLHGKFAALHRSNLGETP